jgi:aminoglycoside phosphotransferase (APT) family kinase protein
MASGGRVTGILDWEMAGTGDPACDFGISTMREWGEWYPDVELLARYRDARGVEIELSSLLWWRALGYVKVVAFLASRMTEGWRGPDLGSWVAGQQRALAEWQSS